MVLASMMLVLELRIYVDTNDVDLSYAVASKNQFTAIRNAGLSQRIVVARQQRLNHQTFTIHIDVTNTSES